MTPTTMAMGDDDDDDNGDGVDGGEAHDDLVHEWGVLDAIEDVALLFSIFINNLKI